MTTFARFSSIGGGLSEPVCGAATPLDIQSGSDALSRPTIGAPLARASGERGTRQLQLGRSGRLLPAPRKRHQHGLQRRRAHERGLALSSRLDILSRPQKTLGRRNAALRACFPAVGASPVLPGRTVAVRNQYKRVVYGRLYSLRRPSRPPGFCLDSSSQRRRAWHPPPSGGHAYVALRVFGVAYFLRMFSVFRA